MALVAAIVVIPNAAAIVAPFEAWPYTNAPMFAADMRASATYRLQLIREGDDEKPFVPAKAVHIPDRLYSRLLLISAYGSMDPDTPFGFVDGDTPDRFEARLDRFFDASFAKVGKKYLEGVRHLRVQLERVDTGEIHVVGRYDVRAKRFEARRW